MMEGIHCNQLAIRPLDDVNIYSSILASTVVTELGIKLFKYLISLGEATLLSWYSCITPY